MPSADLKVFDRVTVSVEGVELLSDAERGFDSYSDLQLLGVHVRISSQLESLRLRVGPDRFTLETDKRAAIFAEPTCSKDPPLQKEYLKGGDSVSGWVAFVVPRSISKATLKTDLRKPFIAVPLSLPGGSGDPGGPASTGGGGPPVERPALKSPPAVDPGMEKPPITERR